MQSKQGLYGSMIPWIHEIKLRPTPPAQLIAVVRISAAHEAQSMEKNYYRVVSQTGPDNFKNSRPKKNS